MLVRQGFRRLSERQQILGRFQDAPTTAFRKFDLPASGQRQLRKIDRAASRTLPIFALGSAPFHFSDPETFIG